MINGAAPGNHQCFPRTRAAQYKRNSTRGIVICVNGVTHTSGNHYQHEEILFIRQQFENGDGGERQPSEDNRRQQLHKHL